MEPLTDQPRDAMNRLKKVSMQDIADALGISKYAVSLALNGKNGVSEKTRTAVIQMATQMNYASMGASSDEASQKIMVLVPEYIRDDHFFYNVIYWTLDLEVAARGYQAISAVVTAQMQADGELPPLYRVMSFAGVILVGVFEESYVKLLRASTDYLVAVDQSYSSLDVDSVVSDNIHGSYQITKYLIGQGHSKIGYVGSITMTDSIFERWCGYRKAMIEANLPIVEDYSILAPSALNDLLSDADELLGLLKQYREYPTAWVCGGDRIAVGLINAIQSLHLRVPDDMSVVGFDNIEAGQLVRPALTTVNVKRKRMASLAVEVLLGRLDGARGPLKYVIPTDLVIRDSVRPLGA